MLAPIPAEVLSVMSYRWTDFPELLERWNLTRWRHRHWTGPKFAALLTIMVSDGQIEYENSKRRNMRLHADDPNAEYWVVMYRRKPLSDHDSGKPLLDQWARRDLDVLKHADARHTLMKRWKWVFPRAFNESKLRLYAADRSVSAWITGGRISAEQREKLTEYIQDVEKRHVEA